MALQGSGQISITQVAQEFGDTAPYGMKEFYNGGGKVPANNTNVPTSGAIGLKNFYNAVNRVALTVTFGANTTQTSVSTTTVPGYIAGISDVTVYVSSGVYVYSTTTLSPALTLGSGFSSGDTIRLINKGFIMGMGGIGGNNGSWANSTQIIPGAGGPAISLSINAIIDNTDASAYIGGGGGGGGAKSGCGGGGAGGGFGGKFNSGSADVPGGGPGQTGTPGWSYNGNLTPNGPPNGGGGGGAGGGGSGQGKLGPTGAGGGGGRIFPGVGGGGASGGGAGGSANNPGAAGGSQDAGGGGGWGAAGGTVTQTGGAGGKAVNLNGKSVTWVAGNTTRVYGAVA